MNLYVLRHGLARERIGREYANDDERPLTAKGMRRMRRQLKGMNVLGLSMDAIVTSPLVRAVQTAEIVHRGIRKPGRLVTSGALRPSEHPATLLEELAAEYSSADDVMVVGHEPYLSGLIAVVVTGQHGPVIRLKKGSLCKLGVPSPYYGRCGWIEWHLTARQMVKMG